MRQHWMLRESFMLQLLSGFGKGRFGDNSAGYLVATDVFEKAVQLSLIRTFEEVDQKQDKG